MPSYSEEVVAAAIESIFDNHGRQGAEANIQSDVKNLILFGGLSLEDEDVVLESPAPNRKRIDVEVGATVIEVKRDLTHGNLDTWIEQKARREASAFWDAWLLVASDIVEGIKLPKSGPSSVFFARRLVPGLPLNFHGWTRSAEAYAEIRIQAESEELSDAIFEACLARKDEIEEDYGGELVWDRLEGSDSAKIDTQPVSIGSRVNPTHEGMIELAEVSNRLIAAFKPIVEEVVAEGQTNLAAEGS